MFRVQNEELGFSLEVSSRNMEAIILSDYFQG